MYSLADMQLRQYHFRYLQHACRVLYPDEQQLRNTYETAKAANAEMPFPYWARLWPASLALSEFIIDHSNLLHSKTVLELAAGVGLPALVASAFATKVYCSDYIADAVNLAEESVKLNGITNMECMQLDWNQHSVFPAADIVLMSDVNYEPAAFDGLLQVFQVLLQQQKTIVLASPQRLMAKPFIAALLPFVQQQQQRNVCLHAVTTAISLYVLKQ